MVGEPTDLSLQPPKPTPVMGRAFTHGQCLSVGLMKAEGHSTGSYCPELLTQYQSDVDQRLLPANVPGLLAKLAGKAKMHAKTPPLSADRTLLCTLDCRTLGLG